MLCVQAMTGPATAGVATPPPLAVAEATAEVAHLLPGGAATAGTLIPRTVHTCC